MQRGRAGGEWVGWPVQHRLALNAATRPCLCHASSKNRRQPHTHRMQGGDKAHHQCGTALDQPIPILLQALARRQRGGGVGQNQAQHLHGLQRGEQQGSATWGIA